jgi:hypothetical protein
MLENAARNSCGLLYHSQDCNVTVEEPFCCETYRPGVDSAVIFKPTIASALTIPLHFMFVKENINPYNDNYINLSM